MQQLLMFALFSSRNKNLAELFCFYLWKHFYRGNQHDDGFAHIFQLFTIIFAPQSHHSNDTFVLDSAR